jgi:hypothetical protein
MACNAPTLAYGVDWTPELAETSKVQMTLKWTEPPLDAGLVDGCHLTGYKLYMSRDNGGTYSEIDAAFVRDKQNLQQH